MQQISQLPKLVFCGGIQLFLDLTRAFDSVWRSRLFCHLAEIGVSSDLLSLISTWHENTHYVLTLHDNSTRIPVGLGLRQGCMIAPILWVAFMDLLLTQLRSKTGDAWIRANLTLYADDIHAGSCFQSAAQFQTTLVNFGHLLDTLEDLKLTLSYQKSFVIFQHAGTNSRAALKGHFKRHPEGMRILIPRRDGIKTPLPVRATAKYLGVIMSYNAFEQQTWTHRKAAAWCAFARLKPWLRSKTISSQHKIHLWRSCIFSVLTYGLHATNVTATILHSFQATVFQMVRLVLGDHAYCTHHTHQRVFHQHNIPTPLQQLSQLVGSARHRLERRSHLLPTNDFLRHIDWSHLSELLKLICCLEASSPEAPVAATPTDPVRLQATLVCPYCHFTTWTVANMRRHQTVVHHVIQYRTAHSNVLDFAHPGTPQCNQCFQVFSSWRRFFIHVQRDCCQASQRPSNLPMTSGAAPVGRTMLASPSVETPAAPATADTDRHVYHQSWWPQLREMIRTKTWSAISLRSDICAFLAHTCVICGLWCNRFQELHGHFRLYHAALVRGMASKCAQLTFALQVSSPCPFCHQSFRRTHSCNVLAQVGVLYVHLSDADSPDAQLLHCDICDTSHESLSILYRHLGTAHSLTIHDWCPARDAHQSSDACRHCGEIFETRSGLQRHIVDSRCAHFDPDASPQTLAAADKWHGLLFSGDFSRKALTAQQRLQLTLWCQFCGQTYARQNDLAAHLMQAHSEVWHKSQAMLRFLLQTVYAVHSCICNPQASDQGRTHICAALRQVAMAFVLSAQAVFVPVQFDRQGLHMQLQHIQQFSPCLQIQDVILSRQFDQLWCNPAILQFLRRHCLLCGGQFSPAALVGHLLTQHNTPSVGYSDGISIH